MRDEGALDSALARPKNIHAYKPGVDLARLAAAYGFGIIRNHPFIDGNKRVGFAAIGLFLSLNGYELGASQVEATQVVMKVAAGKMRESSLAGWVRKSMQREA